MRVSDVLIATALCGFQISVSGFALPYKALLEDVNALDKRAEPIIVHPDPVNPGAPHNGPDDPNSHPDGPVQNPNSPGSQNSGGSDSSIRSAWSTISQRLKNGDLTPGMNEQLTPAEYVTKGEKVEKMNLDALNANPLKGKTYDPASKRYYEEKEDATPEEMSPSSGVEVSLSDLGFKADDEWGWSTFISKGVPLKDGDVDQTEMTLLMGVSKDEKAIMVVYMDKDADRDGTGLNLPKQLYNSELMHQGYLGHVQNPRNLKYVFSHPVYNKGTEQTMLDALKSKNLKSTDKGVFLPNDKGFAGLLGDPWHGLLGTRNGHPVPAMLGDHPDVYGMKVVKIHVWPTVDGVEHGTIVFELGETSAF